MNEPAISPSKKREPSINDVRAPIMMLGIAAFCGGRLGSVPIWSVLVGAAPVMLALALFYERRLIVQLLSWNWRWIFMGVGVCAGLYVLIQQALQLASDLALASTGGEIDGERLPVIFEMLLDLKRHAGVVSPVLVGLLGALLVAPCEEIFWRGFVLTRLMPLVGHWPAVLLTTLFYGGFYWILLGTLASVAAVLTGFAYAALTLKSRSLTPAIVTHALLWALAMGVLPIL